MYDGRCGRTALGVILAGLMLAPASAAQERRPDDRGDRGVPGEAWAFGMGSSIGVSVRDATDAEISAAGVSPSGGAIVTQVTEGGPAAQAGMASGDLVLEFDGERVRSALHLVRLVREAREGRTVAAVVVRDKARRTVQVTPQDGWAAMVDMPRLRRNLDRAARELRRRFEEGAETFGRARPGDRRELGVELMPLSDQLATFFGVRHGVLVGRVEPGSAAAEAGLKAGDVLLAVNGTDVENAADVAREIRRSRTAVTLQVMRDRKELTLKATVPDEPRRPRRNRDA